MLLTVSDDSSVDNHSQDGGLVGSGVIGQQGSGVVITDRGVCWALSNSSSNSSSNGERFE